MAEVDGLLFVNFGVAGGGAADDANADDADGDCDSGRERECKCTTTTHQPHHPPSTAHRSEKKCSIVCNFAPSLLMHTVVTHVNMYPYCIHTGRSSAIFFKYKNTEKIPLEQREQPCKAAGTDSDDTSSWLEASAHNMPEEDFRSVDVDNDNVITQQEVKKWQRQARTRRRQGRPDPNAAAAAAAATDAAEAAEQLAPLLDAVAAAGGTPLKDLIFVRRRVYDLDCNWKVFVDNYLDGGYHVPYAHEALAEGIDMDSYSSRPIGIGSVQEVSKPDDAEGSDRLGAGAAYGFVYPNLMLNRYGPWLDTNTVYPLGEGRCRIVFDYFLEAGTARGVDADAFIDASLGSSNVVQDEDEMLCLGVQAGLGSDAYTQGRYNPVFEAPMHQFHALLHADYTVGLAEVAEAQAPPR